MQNVFTLSEYLEILIHETIIRDIVLDNIKNIVVGKTGAEAEIVTISKTAKDKHAGMIGFTGDTEDDTVYTDEEIEDFFEGIK